MSSIINVLESQNRFFILLKALQISNLADMLNNEGPFTLLAPTDVAFDKVPEIETLINFPNKMRRILSYHIILGNVRTQYILKHKKFRTYEGEKVKFRIDPDLIFNDALVEETNIEAENGVIHVIDKVLIPRNRFIYPHYYNPFMGWLF